MPSKTPFEEQSKNPPPGLGAYAFEEGSVEPNRGWVMVTNDPAPRGNPQGTDKITVVLIKSARQAEDVISGKLDWMLDEPSTDLLPEIRAKYPDRFEENVANSTYYMSMNVEEKPFDKLKVRQAANYAFDKRAAVRLFGGLLEPDSYPAARHGGLREDRPLPVGRSK